MAESADTPSTRPTVASAMAAAEQAAESASTALKVTESQEEALKALANGLGVLQKEQVALAKLVNGLKGEPGDAVKPSKLDNLLTRLEALERVERGVTADWSPMFDAVNERLTALAAKVTEQGQGISALEDKTGVQPGGPFEELAGQVEQLEARLARTEHDMPNPLDDWATVKGALETLQKQEERLASLEHRLGASLTADQEPGPRVGGVGQKVLDLMREVDHIAKAREAKPEYGNGPRYMFRGIEDAQNAVGTAMRKVGLLLRSEVVSWDYSQNQVPNSSGKVVTWGTSRLVIRYTFQDPADGSTFSFEMAGEGKDNSDKSASKAASMACKYALFQALMIPFAQVDESDGHHPVEERAAEPTYTTRPYGQAPARPAAERRGGYDAAADPSAMAGGMGEDTLMQKAAQAAHYLKQAQAQPAEVALSAIAKTREKVAAYGIGDFLVDGVKLDMLVQAALQSVNARIGQQAKPGAQGMTRQAQQSGQGAQARAQQYEAFEESLRTDQEPPPGYRESEQEYLDALEVLTNPHAPEEVTTRALAVVNEYDNRQDAAGADSDRYRETAMDRGDHDY